MASQAGSGNGTTASTNTNPTPSDSVDTNETGMPRIAGVRSNNPFASAESGANERSQIVSESPASPGAGSAEFHDAASGRSVARDSNNQHTNFPTSANGPVPDDSSDVDPFDHSDSETNPQPRVGAAPDGRIQDANSVIHQREREGGTDLFANGDPFSADSGHASSSRSGSDNENGHKDEGISIAFGDGDKTDKALAHSNSSNNILGKIKGTAHDVKDKMHLQDIKSTGPFKAFNPTNVRMRVRFGHDASDPGREVGIIWRSRDNRKGRNSIVVPRASLAYPNIPAQNRPVYSSSFKGIGRNLYRMAFTFPYWDMAFWSGWSYTWGSVLFIIDGIWAWIPYGWGLDLGDISEYGVGIVFFIGALLYQLGAVMAWLEAINDGSFHGSAMKRFLEGHEYDTKKLLDDKIHSFFGHLNPMHALKHHKGEEAEAQADAAVNPDGNWKTIHRRERLGSIYTSEKAAAPRRGGIDLGEEEEGESHEYLTWRWWPTWHAVKTHHIYEIGFVACSIQLFGATLYSWCGLVALPPIFAVLATTQEYGAYWFPEVLGSCCFLTASFLFLLETQEKWWKPQPNVMGWWIGVWAMVGSWGFLFCGIFGFVDVATEANWAGYQSELSSTWGSFAYLLSGFCQWYEAVNKHPVEEDLGEPGATETSQLPPV